METEIKRALREAMEQTLDNLNKETKRKIAEVKRERDTHKQRRNGQCRVCV